MLNRMGRAAKDKITGAWSAKRTEIQLSRPIASVTFDDFPKNAWETGGAILERWGVRGTYFVCGGYCGQTVNGIEYFSKADLEALHRAGHEVGCHTFDHFHLPQVPAAGAHASIERNAAFVADVLGVRPMASFAYPYGEASLFLKRRLSRRFNVCRGVAAGINAGWADLSQLRAVCLEDHILARRPLTAWIDEAWTRRGWLILLTHDVSPGPTSYGCRPGLLADAVRRLLDSGVEILPVQEAFSRIGQPPLTGGGMAVARHG